MSFPYSVGDHELLEITPQGAKAKTNLNPAKKGNGKSSNLTDTKERIGRYSTVIRVFWRTIQNIFIIRKQASF